MSTPPRRGRCRGATSNERYVERPERDRLTAVQQPLGRPESTCAALIPIRKSEAWWDLTQDERRAVFEERSHHIAVGLDYLPAVARRLHHARDLGGAFDFLAWFEYAPEASADFEELVGRLRATEEWSYVDREVDIRLRRASPSAAGRQPGAPDPGVPLTAVRDGADAISAPSVRGLTPSAVGGLVSPYVINGAAVPGATDSTGLVPAE